MTSADILKGIIAALSAAILTAVILLFCAAIAHRDSDEEVNNEH